MAQAPIMPLFTDALIGDTTHLSTEQFGAYVLILIATWRNNGRALPDDEKQLANVCRVGTKKWRLKLRPLVSKFFTIDDTGWHQKRLEAEWKRIAGIIEMRRAIGSRGGLAKAQAIARANGEAKHKQPMNYKEASLPKGLESTSNTESLNAAREEKKISEKESFERPEGALGIAARCRSRPCPGEAAPDGGVQPRSLPTNSDDLDPQAENNHNSQQEPAMCMHGFSPELAPPRTTLDGVGVLGSGGRHCRPAPKSATLKAKIKQQCVWKHCRFLRARGHPGEWQWYFDQIDAKTGFPPGEVFEAVDARMRAERWDDMRAWKWQHGIPCDGNDTQPGMRDETASELLVRTGGWYHGNALLLA